jgi:WD40 repeat protein
MMNAIRPPSLTPFRTVITNFEARSVSGDNAYEEGVWVLFACSSEQWLSCALTNGDVKLYDKERLEPIHTYTNGHHLITDLQSGSGPNMLIVSGMNGQVALYDVRQSSKPALTFVLPKSEAALSVSLGYDGALAAIGGAKAHVHFFDVRGGGVLLGSYRDSHTEEVTKVRFQSKLSPLLVSGSEDGLSCIFDTSQPSEDAALKSVLNVQTPLREVGFFGPSLEGVYCLTGSETMSVWHHDSAQRICDFGLDLRTQLSQVSGGTPMEYLVNCYWDDSQEQLSLLAGNHSGDGGMFKVDAGSISIQHLLLGGHRGDIRSWCTLAPGTFATVGEDARLCEWNTKVGSAVPPNNLAGSERVNQNAVGGPIRRNKTKTPKSPY